MTEAHDEARSPYFTPRRLGAAMPAHPEHFRLDWRDPCDGTPPDAFDPPLRSFSDPGLLTELDLLLKAGLRVNLSSQTTSDETVSHPDFMDGVRAVMDAGLKVNVDS